VIEVGPLIIDTERRIARVNGDPLRLTTMEWSLLAHLVSDPQRLFTRWELERDVWGYQSPGRSRCVTSTARRLRKKLRAQGFEAIINVPGHGYRLADPVQVAA